MTQINVTATLQRLFQLDPTLAAQLEDAKELDQVVELITESAGKHGVTVDKDALVQSLQTLMADAAKEIDDESLAAVAGGASPSGRWWHRQPWRQDPSKFIRR